MLKETVNNFTFNALHMPSLKLETSYIKFRICVLFWIVVKIEKYWLL